MRSYNEKEIPTGCNARRYVCDGMKNKKYFFGTFLVFYFYLIYRVEICSESE